MVGKRGLNCLLRFVCLREAHVRSFAERQQASICDCSHFHECVFGISQKESSYHKVVWRGAEWSGFSRVNPLVWFLTFLNSCENR